MQSALLLLRRTLSIVGGHRLPGAALKPEFFRKDCSSHGGHIMNVVSALFALHLALLCLASVALARPSSFSPGGGGSGANGESSGRSSEDGRPRGRNRPGRKIRLLQRVLRQLSQNEVQALLRTKKSRPRNSSYAPYFSVEPSRPQITLPEIGKSFIIYHLYICHIQ